MTSSSPSSPPSQTSSPRLHPLSDIFPDSPPSTPRLASALSEIPRLQATHNTAGYRDGISSSKTASLQPGFDEGYSLGAVLGLKVGYVLGVLEGLYAAFGDGAADGDGSTQGEPDWKAERRMKMRAILAEARRELTVEKVFGKEWWGPDGIWTFDVEPDVEITFEQVAEMHPLLQVWTRRAREEMESLGIRQGMYEGEEWESGRAVEGEVDAS